MTVTRPTSGTYDMLVAGGTAQQAGLPAGVQAVSVVDCARAVLRHIVLMFDNSTGHDAARQIVGNLGIGHGISASTPSTDCMCVADSGCTPLTATCTVGGPNTRVSSNVNCEAGGATIMDERQKFLTAFGAHP